MEIEVKQLGMIYPNRKQALEDIHITLKSPGLIGLLGPNGAGKTTFMKLLVAGLLPTSGVITIDGIPLQKCEKQTKARLGYLPQAFGLYEELTVWQFLDYMSALKGLRHANIDQILATVDLQEKRNARIGTLSGGQRQRVGIAQALLGKPELLIFDEPTVGLDPEERIRFRNFFAHTAQDKIVILSTHIIEDIQAVCSHLIVLSEGHVRFVGSPEQLIQAAQGHVGVFYQGPKGEIAITSQMNTAKGIVCRGVAETLPEYAQAVEPTLEDAYLFLIHQRSAV